MSKRKADEALEEPEVEEVWKDCLDLYEVSNLGNVRRKSDKRPIKTRLDGDGYYICGLHYERKSVKSKIHRLVAIAFLQQPSPEHNTVDHINRLKTDNRLSNIRWATRKEQTHNTSERKKYPRPSVRITDGKMIEDFDDIDKVIDYLIDNLSLTIQRITIKTQIIKAIRGKYPYKGFTYEYTTETPTGATEKIPSLPLYEASSCGMIKGINGRWSRGRIQSGYYIIGILDASGKPIQRQVHRLVAETFISGRTEKLNIVNHLNGIRTDNRVENLEWTDYRGNAQHARDTGLQPTPPGKQIKQIDIQTGDLVMKHISLSSAARHVNGHLSNIGACANGRRETTCGFKWSWCETS